MRNCTNCTSLDNAARSRQPLDQCNRACVAAQRLRFLVCMKSNRFLRVLTILSCALVLTVMSSTASAQGRSFDGRKQCNNDRAFRDLVYSYLTGNKRTKSKTYNLLTSGKKKQLKINRGPLTLSTFLNPASGWMAGTAVSIPFTAVKSAATLSFELVNGKDTHLTACQYAVKQSANWGRFKPSDLTAVWGRSLSKFGNNTKVSLRMGKKRPPKGYHTSTVVLLDLHVLRRNKSKRTLKNMKLRTSR